MFRISFFLQASTRRGFSLLLRGVILWLVGGFASFFSVVDSVYLLFKVGASAELMMAFVSVRRLFFMEMKRPRGNV